LQRELQAAQAKIRIARLALPFVQHDDRARNSGALDSVRDPHGIFDDRVQPTNGPSDQQQAAPREQWMQ
jgi:hypothetical protein